MGKKNVHYAKFPKYKYVIFDFLDLKAMHAGTSSSAGFGRGALMMQ